MTRLRYLGFQPAARIVRVRGRVTQVAPVLLGGQWAAICPTSTSIRPDSAETLGLPSPNPWLREVLRSDPSGRLGLEAGDTRSVRVSVCPASVCQAGPGSTRWLPASPDQRKWSSPRHYELRCLNASCIVTQRDNGTVFTSRGRPASDRGIGRTAAGRDTGQAGEAVRTGLPARRAGHQIISYRPQRGLYQCISS